MSLRVYLTGRMALETAEGMTDEAAFPGRQGRIAFAFLALSAQRPVARDVLADALWPDALPTSWDSALKSLVSKLRSLLVEAGVDDEPIVGAAGCYQLRLPVDAWVDLEACATAVDYAEGALRRGDLDLACSNGTVATAIARRPFLAGEDAPWIDTVRSDLRSWHVRALDVLAQAWIGRGNATLAVAIAADAVALEPFREPGYRVLMRAQALAGNRAEALRTYDRCAQLFADELGVEPDPETIALRDTLRQPRRSLRPSQTMTIAVTDIVGSTDLAARLGDREWSAVLGKHDQAMRECVETANGQVIKHLGDGFLLTFGSAGAALEGLEHARRAVGLIDVYDRPLTLRVGVHAGEPVEQDEDVFGLQVNVAARINALAAPGEILVSQLIRDLAPPGTHEFGAPRVVSLKGVPGEFTVYTVR